MQKSMKEFVGNKMIRKAIVTAAGKGKRLMPLTDAIPKEIIRVGNKPAIEHVLNVLKSGGIKDVLIITAKKKNALIDYLGSGEKLGLNIYYRIQEEQKGTAHAISLGEDFIGHEEFAVMYGDNYITPYNTMEKIVNFHKKNNSKGTLVLHPVDDPSRFGIVSLDDKKRINKIVEKPSLKVAEKLRTNDHFLSIAGLMILDSKIFDYIRKTKVGKQKEKWLTDSIELMRKDGNQLFGYEFNGKRFDIGTFESLRIADMLEIKRQIEED